MMAFFIYNFYYKIYISQAFYAKLHFGDFMKKCIFMLMLGLIMATSSLAIAAEKKGPFAKMDTNNDGKISLDEYKNKNAERMEEAFKAADTNNDGALSKEEVKAMRSANKEKRAEKKN